MSHLSPDELVDLLDGALAPDRQAHVAECPQCGEQFAELSHVLRRTRDLDVTEPSPLFWDRLSDRVRFAIADEPAASRRQPWFAWPVLAPLAGLALLVLALGVAVSRDRMASDAAAAVEALADATAGPDDPALEAVWALMSDLVSNLDEATEAELLVAPGSADRAAVQLSQDEQVELVRLLRQELGRSGG